MSPQKEEKELFTVIVHENQFVANGQRIHHLLELQTPYPKWMEDAILSNALEENFDY